MPERETRFTTTFQENPTDNPGLVMDEDGNVLVVLPDGTRVPVTGGDGSLSVTVDLTVPDLMEIGDGDEIEIVAAPGAGKALMPMSGGSAQLVGTIAYDATVNLRVNSPGLGGSNANVFLGSVRPWEANDPMAGENLPLILHNGGDSWSWVGGLAGTSGIDPDAPGNGWIPGDEASVLVGSPSFDVAVEDQGARIFRANVDWGELLDPESIAYLIIYVGANTGAYTVVSITETDEGGALVEVTEAIPSPDTGSGAFGSARLDIVSVANAGPITGVNQGDLKFTVPSGIVAAPGDHLVVYRSTGNDGVYEIVGVVGDVIEVDNPIASATVDGWAGIAETGLVGEISDYTIEAPGGGYKQGEHAEIRSLTNPEATTVSGYTTVTVVFHNSDATAHLVIPYRLVDFEAPD